MGVLVDPRHFHLLKTPKDATKDHPCHLSPPWYGSMPGQTLRSYRSHRVYTAYIVRSGGNSPPQKKWVNSKSLLRKRRVLSPYMRPNQSCFFYYSSDIEINHDVIWKKRGISSKSRLKIFSLWSTFEGCAQSQLLWSLSPGLCALGLSNITMYAKKSLGGTQKKVV